MSFVQNYSKRCAVLTFTIRQPDCFPRYLCPYARYDTITLGLSALCAVRVQWNRSYSCIHVSVIIIHHVDINERYAIDGGLQRAGKPVTSVRFPVHLRQSFYMHFKHICMHTPM